MNTNVKGANLELFAKVMEQLTGEVKDAFGKYVEKYEAKNAKVAAKRAEKKAGIDAELIADIMKVLSKDTAMSRDQIFAKLPKKVYAGKDITVQKISTVLSTVDGVNIDKAKIADKKGKVTVYTLA